MDKKLLRFKNKTLRGLIKILSYVDTPLYMKLYVKHLRTVGMNFTGKPTYIGNSVYFDGSDYSLITIGNNVCISREVLFLTHDLSMNIVYKDIELSNIKAIKNQLKINNLLVLKNISIGDNTFIGARATILQGATIGKNVLVGAGSVVRGNIPDYSIIAGNPAVVIDNTKEWLERKRFS